METCKGCKFCFRYCHCLLQLRCVETVNGNNCMLRDMVVPDGYIEDAKSFMIGFFKDLLEYQEEDIDYDTLLRRTENRLKYNWRTVRQTINVEDLIKSYF